MYLHISNLISVGLFKVFSAGLETFLTFNYRMEGGTNSCKLLKSKEDTLTKMEACIEDIRC